MYLHNSCEKTFSEMKRSSRLGGAFNGRQFVCLFGVDPCDDSQTEADDRGIVGQDTSDQTAKQASHESHDTK